jgi:hypothetical protein
MKKVAATSSCVTNSKDRTQECAAAVLDWHDEAFQVLRIATDPEIPFLIDIKNICDTKVQCGCFLRGSPTRYVPTCFNQLVSVNSAKMTVLLDTEKVHSKFSTEFFPEQRAFSRGFVVSPTGGGKYDVKSAVHTDRSMVNVSEHDIFGIFDYVISEFQGIVGYEFEASIAVEDVQDYIRTLTMLTTASGDPAGIFNPTGQTFTLIIDPTEDIPYWDIHVTLDDRLVWHIAEFCEFDFSTSRPTIRVGMLSSNVPPLSL